MKLTILKFTLNGEPMEIPVSPSDMLVDIIREKLHLTGTKIGCGMGECGACTVIMNGETVASCLVPALKAMGANIETVEGVGKQELHPVQEAFMDLSAIQCGYCTPGMIVSAKALLDKNPNPSSVEIREAISGNICRCTGYVRIEKAIMLAAQKLQERREKSE